MTNNLPLELIEIICKKLDGNILFEICIGNKLLDNLNNILVKKYLDEIGINGLILKGNLPGVKYMIDSKYDITRNDNYALKWAKICDQKNIVDYIENHLKSLGKIDSLDTCNIDFNVSSHYEFFTKRFSIKLRKLHIDCVKCIKYINISREITGINSMGFSYEIFNNAHGNENWGKIKQFQMENPNYCEIFVKNLNVKYHEGNILLNIPLILTINDFIAYKWNSEEIITVIIPVEATKFSTFRLQSDIFPKGIPGNITINYDLGFLPIKYFYHLDFFNYSSGIVNDIPENCQEPDPSIFGINRPKNKIYDLLLLSSETMGIAYSFDSTEKSSNDYIDYLAYHYTTYAKIFMENKSIQSCEKIKQMIVMYGELCLPYDIYINFL